ncbi:MAG: cytochrome c biogenesis protein CcsA [Saprospiraceae bacterium]|nr:cytochrome c biogenesis protein CcsA [Saprospiraceae bacterium]
MLESLYYTTPIFKVAFLAYVITLILYLAISIKRNKFLEITSLAFFSIGFLLCTYLIVDRWIDAGRPPFKSLYESLIFAIWTISLVSLTVEWRYRISLIGLLSSIGIIIIFVYALFKRDIEIIALPPALQTWLFIPHVISYFLAYGALFVAGLAATLHLILPDGITSHHTLGRGERVDFSEFTYEITKFGFLFLTAGLLLGAWWGQVAWSNYWGWDPKENWAFITWLLFCAYFHFRNITSWSKKRLSWVVILGVVAIIFTYLGMDYLPTANDSLHVYTDN